MMNGIGTLIYLFICRGKAPAFLGSSFALRRAQHRLHHRGLEPGWASSTRWAVRRGRRDSAVVSLIIRLAGREWLNVVSAARGDGRDRHADRPRAGPGGHRHGLHLERRHNGGPDAAGASGVGPRFRCSP